MNIILAIGLLVFLCGCGGGGGGSTGSAQASESSPAPIVMCFGSSITDGQGGANDYIKGLQRRLGDRATVINRGYNGNCSLDGYRSIYAEVSQRRPAIVMIEYSINDCAYELPVPLIEKWYRSIIARSMEYGAQRIILMTTNPARGRENIEEYNDLYRRLAQEIPGVVLIDGYLRWNALSPEDYERYIPDHVHPTTEGWEVVMGDEIARIVGDNLP